MATVKGSAAYFDAVVSGIVRRERGAGTGYVDHPSDKGGPTKDGITEAVARANGWKGEMRELPDAMVRAIYLGRYITIPRFDWVYSVNTYVGAELIDTGVLMGPGTAALWFQQWLNGFNQRGRLYADLFEDGRLGAVTLEAFRAYMQARGPEGGQVMVAALNSSQGSRMLTIARADESQEDFLYGWVRGRVLGQAADA